MNSFRFRFFFFLLLFEWTKNSTRNKRGLIDESGFESYKVMYKSMLWFEICKQMQTNVRRFEIKFQIFLNIHKIVRNNLRTSPAQSSTGKRLSTITFWHNNFNLYLCKCICCVPCRTGPVHCTCWCWLRCWHRISFKHCTQNTICWQLFVARDRRKTSDVRTVARTQIKNALRKLRRTECAYFNCRWMLWLQITPADAQAWLWFIFNPCHSIYELIQYAKIECRYNTHLIY